MAADAARAVPGDGAGSRFPAPGDGAGSDFAEDKEGRERRRVAGERFRKRLARGDYRALVDGRLGEVMGQAAREAGVEEEVGALRVTLARLMDELAGADDPLPVSLAIARVANAAVRAQRARAVVGSQDQREFDEALRFVLTEINAPRTDEPIEGAGFGAEEGTWSERAALLSGAVGATPGWSGHEALGFGVADGEER